MFSSSSIDVQRRPSAGSLLGACLVAAGLALGCGTALGQAPPSSFKAAFRVASADEVAAALGQARQSLDKVVAHLAGLPEGALLRDALRLEAIARELGESTPATEAADTTMRALRMKRPGGLEPLLAELRVTLETWRSLATFDAAAQAQAIERWRRIAEVRSADLVDPHVAAAWRADFAALARLHRVDEELDQLRARFAQPNHIVAVNAHYLEAVAARRFDAPINVRERRDGTLLTARAKLPVRTSLELPEAHRHAAIRLYVDARGGLDLTACRGKLFVAAKSNVCLDGSQLFHLTGDGVAPRDPDIDLSSRTRLTGVDVSSRVGGRVAERVVAKVATRKLPDADRRATRAAKPALEARVSQECEQIAQRINGLFHQLYVGPLLAFDVDPAIQFRSGPGGIIGTATYARHDQLGALVPPPPPRISQDELSYVTYLHESAINNLAEQWAGKQLDEATFWMVLNEEFKFRSDEVEALPPGRPPAVIQLGRQPPVSLRLAESGLDVTMRFRGFSEENEEATLHVRYDLTAGTSGIQLARSGDLVVEPSTTIVDHEALSRFFPSRLTPRQRFRGEQQPQRQVVRELRLEDGWLVLGVGPAPAAREVAQP